MSSGFGRPSGFLTLTTDFGTQDHYIGVMKGVVASIAPHVKVVDICHEIPRFDIREGAFAVSQACGYFPVGTVHVVVVDPGVGSGRRPLAAAVGGHCFIAPDNGVLSQVLDQEDASETRCIDVRHGLDRLSQTFHGRDLFAPSGARLANGLPFAEVGPPVPDPVRQTPVRVVNGKGRVLHIDVFGNIVTNFRPRDVPVGTALVMAGASVAARADSYAAMHPKRLFLIVGSSGYLEISLNQGSAARELDVQTGDKVMAVPPDDGMARRGGCPGQSARDVS